MILENYLQSIQEGITYPKLKKIYHYGKDLHSDLRTLKVRGEDPGDKGYWSDKYKPGKYSEHISFFLEPAPVDILGSVFKGVKHPVWFTGNILYEYEVDISSMPEFVYCIAESPLSNKLLHDNSTSGMSNTEYAELLQKIRIETGEIGYSKREFLKVAPQYVGILKQEYLKLPHRPNWNELKLLYAGGVVHAMIYPKGGIIKYSYYKQVKVGSRRN